ncbi:molecular chaperone GroEL [Roseovarius sp. B08]|uniref:molecular chaperone GroEL n=1 Tax=Roseovarius sp. B08 TaxID=3449223 RepID=UPI003EDC17D7
MSDSVRRFFNAWGDGDAEARMAVLNDVLATGVRYADPRLDEALVGPAAVMEYVGQYSAMAPGAIVQIASMETRDSITRATVEFIMADGHIQLGQFVIEMDGDQRLTRVVGFKGTGA